MLSLGLGILKDESGTTMHPASTSVKFVRNGLNFNHLKQIFNDEVHSEAFLSHDGSIQHYYDWYCLKACSVVNLMMYGMCARWKKVFVPYPLFAADLRVHAWFNHNLTKPPKWCWWGSDWSKTMMTGINGILDYKWSKMWHEVEMACLSTVHDEYPSYICFTIMEGNDFYMYQHLYGIV